ncbi:hypothetical protein JCM10449v2_005220 [Rhodotorula kratochvilovae]
MTPSPSTASLSSLVTALSEADETAQSARLLFSPKSARTSGTGATGSTEPEGEATRSLVASTDGRGAAEEGQGGGARTNPRVGVQGREDLLDALLGSPGGRSRASGETEWTRLSAGELSLGAESSVEQMLVHLPTPEPEEPLLPPAPIGSADKPALPGEDSHDDAPAIYIKAESDDGLSAQALLARPASPSSSSHEHPASPPPDTLTDSQEGALLDQSVTRSQSDFSHWLEETLRLARGDGSSTIESDDALSSIIEATRHAQLGWVGAPRSAVRSEDGESSDDAAPAELPEEDWALGTVRTRETEMKVEGQDEAKNDEAVEGEKEVEPVFESATLSSATPSSSRGWKILSLALTAALAYSLKQQAVLSTAMKLQPEPTRALHFVPLNETAEVSQFATPIPVGSALSLPVYALLFTLIAGVSASVPLLRRHRAEVASRPSCTARARSRSASSTPPTRSRATSPLLELNGDALLSARALLPLGISQYAARNLSAATATFGAIVALPCAPADKALASEWRGRALYRLARADGNDPALLEEAAGAFERAIRLDGGRATPRASLGRVKYRLGEYEGAVHALRAALKRDEELAVAHEFLAKALARLDPRPADAARAIEAHLVRAIELDPHSPTALAFLGEFLHLSPGGGGARLYAARGYLERAIALRDDYPAAHARLAFIANEALDAPSAAAHYAAVIRTRHTGLRDADAMPASERACEGPAPFLAWAFVTPRTSPERRRVLAAAAKEHPHDDLVALLLAIEETPSGTGAGAPSEALLAREAALARRCARFSPDEDLPAHGLWALALLALGRTDDAQAVYGRFWEAVAARRGAADEDRQIAFLAMAFYEVKGAEERVVPRGRGGKKAPVRATPKRAMRAVKREEDGAPAVEGLVVEVKAATPLRRSPRKHAVEVKA